MGISVLLAYYKNLPALELVLEAFSNQTYPDFELIIAEDDNNPDTGEFLELARGKYKFPIQHLDQDVKVGFRKTEMLNRAIRIAKSEILVFIDGDCIPNRYFLEQHHKHQEDGYFLFGRRVLLGEGITEKTLVEGTLSYLNFFSILFSDSSRKKEGIYFPLFGLHAGKGKKLSGHNWSVKKSKLLMINGFDEDYNRPGVGEDYDVEWRLKAMGLKMKSVKNKAIVYHLFHPRTHSGENVEYVYSLLKEKKIANRHICLNGLEKLS